MPSYDKDSQDKLDTCMSPLRNLFNSVIKGRDNTILYSLKSKEDQTKGVRNNASKFKFPDSPHNGISPKFDKSSAVDVAPYPIPNGWSEINSIAKSKNCMEFEELLKFYEFSAIVKYEWAKMQASDKSCNNYELIWGGDFETVNLNDLIHYELVKKKKPKKEQTSKTTQTDD